jgi:hypothetical protein
MIVNGHDLPPDLCVGELIFHKVAARRREALP